ncbi:response regulator transcription factor [Candidatus Saccharibacteria bacterium]|jgi:DNA-binding response OmpR family regulator|nr:response regulator transcription factor [Candidatus Saccharibacteria bacterium]HPR09217.1 response regulator transcription factor [Candidatus Saccharibacteria bacterium]
MKLLLIEDEPKLNRVLTLGLIGERMTVESCFDGDSGLAMALADEYDVIICDRMLPGSIDGIQVCQQIRRANITTPILFLTAKDAVADRVAGLDAGADDYMVKPFSFEELLARIRALLRRNSAAKNPILSVADLTLDPATFVVQRANTPIKLSQTEYALLEYFMRNTGRILTKDTLISHVWDFDADILPNTVEAYVGYLRNKIDKPFATPLLHTVRGFGYKLGIEH